MRIFLGVTGASGAPYAAAALRALTEAGCDVGLCVSDSGAHVLSHELFGGGPRPPADPEGVVARLVDGWASPAGRVTVLGQTDMTSPFASGSSRSPGALIAPCSGATLASIAHGLSRNLIHRCADVMLKEGKPLVLVPRETPLSLIHLENMAAARRAGATILAAMPPFYTLPETIDDMVGYVVGKALDHLGVEHDLVRRWGLETEAPAH